MNKVVATKADVIWGYIGTFLSMFSSFLLLPFLVKFLTGEELGLWYVYTALASFALMFEFGFNPTLARNITYVIGGAKDLHNVGKMPCERDYGVNWKLLNTVISASKMVYVIIALALIPILLVPGSIYIAYVSSNVDTFVVWSSWLVFVVAIVTNIAFLWPLTVLRGYGDIAGENRARALARLVQLVLTIIMLNAGTGLLGAALGYFSFSLTQRFVSVVLIKRHKEIESGRQSVSTKPSMQDIVEVLRTVGGIAWRDGVVSFSNYATTQAISIISSLFLGLTATGVYSMALQLSNAVVNLSSVFPKTYFPTIQAAYARGDIEAQRRNVGVGIVAYWFFFAVSSVAVVTISVPLVALIKPGTEMDPILMLAMCLYMGLWNHHSIFCNYIVGMNEIPYMASFLASGAAGIVLACVLCGVFDWGAWGILVGQAIAQGVYNNWKWPQYLCKKLDTTYMRLMKEGVLVWRRRVVMIFGLKEKGEAK